jgi:hypothetical protein
VSVRALACLCLLAACGRPGPAPLPECAAFAGDLALVLPRGDRIAGRVAFDRKAGTLQFTWVQANGATTLLRRSGEVVAFAGSEFRAADAAEGEVLGWVEQAVAPGPFRAIGDGVYERTLPAGELRVEARAAAGPHGTR